MSKSNGRGLFGWSRTDAVTLVDAPVSRAYARKARVTFYVVTAIVAVLTAVALSHRYPPIVGLLLGLFLGALVGLVAGAVVLAWPAARVLWHWTVEILAGLGVVFGWTALMNSSNLGVSLAVVALLAGVPAAVPAVRRTLLAGVWCVIVRHRLRLCFTEFVRSATRGRTGNPPLILAARPTPAGERVWVWLRTGLDLSDLEGKTSKLAVACWADQVQVVRASSSYAALIRVDIARRDPLLAIVSSPLVGLIPPWDPATAPVSPGMTALALDLPAVPDPVTPGPAPRTRKPRPDPSTASVPVIGPVGDDDAFI